MLLLSYLGWRILSKPWLETSFLALLPRSEQQPQLAEVIQRQQYLLNRKVVWLIGASDPEQAVAEAKQLHQRLQQTGLFAKLTLTVPTQQFAQRYQQLFNYRYQLLTPELSTLLANDPKALIAQNLGLLNSPLGQLEALSLAQDPLLLFSRYQRQQLPLALNLVQEVPVIQAQQRAWAILQSELHDGHLQLDKLEALQQLWQSTQQTMRRNGGELLATGLPLFTAAGAASAKQEISTVGLGSSIGILLLLWWTFHSVRPLLLSSLAIASGLGAALVVSVWVFGKVHILTLVFGASLIGVADDYAQHLLCDSLGERQWQPYKSLRAILPALSFGLISNLLSYAGLGFSPFPGLQEVALFSAVGLLVAWLTVVMVFPVLLTGFNFSHQPTILRLTQLWEQRWPQYLLQQWRKLSLLALAFISTGIYQLSPQDDVRLLQSPDQQLAAMADNIKQLLPVLPDSQFFWVSGQTMSDWFQNEARLVAALRTLKQQGALSDFQSISQYWPDRQKQQDNYQLLKQHWYANGQLASYMQDLGFAKASIKKELQQFAAAQAHYLSLEQWLANSDEAKQALWLGCQQQGCQSIISLNAVKQIPALAALSQLPGVVWVDQVQSVSELFARYRARASLLLAMAFTLATCCLCLKFGWRQALAVISVPSAAVLMALACLGWGQQLFSLFNLFALLLVLGIGIDYGLFFLEAGERRANTSLGVTLSALTTLLAFGLLALSKTQIVHAFGFTVTVGIITSLLCAPLVGFRKLG